MKRVRSSDEDQNLGQNDRESERESRSMTMTKVPDAMDPKQPHGAGSHSLLPPEFMEILAPSFQVGLGTGLLGVFTGAVSGIVRSPTPVLFSLASGVQWFTLGSSYYASRMVLDRSLGGRDNLTGMQKVESSTIAGGVSGMLGGMMRGPRNVLPGMVVFSMLGAGGQAVANTVDPSAWKNIGNRFLSSKWSPVTPISDEDYKKILEEKLLKVEAELAILDDNIKTLRASEQQSSHETQESRSTAPRGDSP
ncbi:hypothetical protein VTK73DRAFT_6578 [Phialemonium thermophilum]|uniref:Uncharacterized protein n=1 Tax=Phialemonium thermophilum TaxID=223376 RepID=A0ABR3WJ37_9PEZI